MALENTLLDIRHPETGRRTRYVQTEDGAIIVNQQDRTAILERNAIERSMFDKWNGYKANVSSNGWTKVASIPLVDFFAADARGVCRHPASFRAWLNRSDTRQFRTDDGRTL